MFRIAALLALAACCNAAAVVKYLHVLSEVQTRFANTDLISLIENGGAERENITYTAELPPGAFIKAFYLERYGEVTFGQIKEKSLAEQEFEVAAKDGKTAARLRESNLNTFELTMSLAPFSTVSFNLTYQEILHKSHSLYKHVINVKSDLPITDLEMNVLLADRHNFSTIHVPQFGSGLAELPNSELLKRDADTRVQVQQASDPTGSLAYVNFSPGQSSEGQLVLLYNTTLPEGESELQVVNGYFLHQYAPPADAVPGNKTVVFVLDKSGSMRGEKLQQLKESFNTILDEVSENDTINILLFDKGVTAWKPLPIKLDAESRLEAKNYIEGISAGGGTNMGEALREGMQMLTDANIDEPRFVSMLVFLTDGQPTIGELNAAEMIAEMRKYSSSFVIHSVSFGRAADYQLMKKISAQYNGLARRIFESSDAGLQIAGFYDDISLPIMKNMKISYIDESVDSTSIVTPDDGSLLFAGNDVVTVGKLNDDAPIESINALLEGTTEQGVEVVKTEVKPSSVCYEESLVNELNVKEVKTIEICGRDNSIGNFIERMWAHQTVLKYERLLDVQTKSAEEKKNVAEQVKRLALKYGFVTSQTAMVVVVDGEKQTLQEVNEEDAGGDNTDDQPRRLHAAELSSKFKVPFNAKQEIYTGDCHVHLFVIVDRAWTRKLNAIKAHNLVKDLFRALPTVSHSLGSILPNRSISIDEGDEEALFSRVAKERASRVQLLVLSEMSASLERPLTYLQVLQPALQKMLIVNPFSTFSPDQKALLREVDDVIVYESPSPKELTAQITC